MQRKVERAKLKDEAGSSNSMADVKKKRTNELLTPRNYLQSASTVDIYGQKKPSKTNSNAPKKDVTNIKRSYSTVPKDTKITPTFVKNASTNLVKKHTLQSTGSTNSVKSLRKGSNTIQKLPVNDKKVPAKEISNVTVNSPMTKRKITSTEISSRSTKDFSKLKVNNLSKEENSFNDEFQESKKADGRLRTKTRTLKDEEIKLLKDVDNNEEMKNLTKKLSAQPKAFYVDLDGRKSENIFLKSSDEEDSYEDDFESYESDFESYHSDETSPAGSRGEYELKSGEGEHGSDDEDTELPHQRRDVEGMLDSGAFELRSSSRSKATPLLLEEEDASKKTSLTDDGFQEMSSTTPADSLERPMFLDFKKSQENKRKRRLAERMKQRAADILSMVALHEMAYALFELRPVPYELFMLTFGRHAHAQQSTQTAHDALTQQTQTDRVTQETKWTQHPVAFSNNSICINDNTVKTKMADCSFEFLSKSIINVGEGNIDESYLENPLRLYFDQKDGAGTCNMMPHETYKVKLENIDYCDKKLKRFLKKSLNKVSHALSANSGAKISTNLQKDAKYPFSKGYISISTKTIKDNKYYFLKKLKIRKLILSEDKHDVVMTVFERSSFGVTAHRSIICLWDTSVTNKEPVKILVAIDDVTVGRLKGNPDGIFVAALQDNSVHIWDLSEPGTWKGDVADVKTSNLVEVNSEAPTQTERDREWNLRNSHVAVSETDALEFGLQSCAFASSGEDMLKDSCPSPAVGLELYGDTRSLDGGRRHVGMVGSLQRTGILTIWQIIQDKSSVKDPDIGKAYWSRIRLERTQTVNLCDYLDPEIIDHKNFNLNSAKRRLSGKRREINKLSRLKSAGSLNYEQERHDSAANYRNQTMLPTARKSGESWESGIVCYELRVVRMDNVLNWLVGKNCGEVLCCCNVAGVWRVQRLRFAAGTSSVTCLQPARGLPYLLAANDVGTLQLYSLHQRRGLLTLDCRNIPPAVATERSSESYLQDSKGRYVGSALSRSHTHGETEVDSKLSVSRLCWVPSEPCSVFASTQDGALIAWQLAHSDIYANFYEQRAVCDMTCSSDVLALLSAEGEVQLHRLSLNQTSEIHSNLFKKYVSRL